MNPQFTTASSFLPSSSSHLPVDGETCPSCGQAIRVEKLDEISGRIALKEREQALAIRTKLEQQYEIERAQAAAKANTELDLERRQSAARVALAREETQRAAEILINEKLAEAERTRHELQATWQRQFEEAEEARKVAEQTGASLHAQMQQLRQDSAAALEAAKAEAK